MNNYSNVSRTLEQQVSAVMKQVYLRMFLALIITAGVAFFAANSVSYINFLVQNQWLMWVLLLGELGIVFSVSGAINRISSTVATLLFFLFAVINGLTLCTIFWVYSPEAITKTFLITSATFGAMSVFGYVTKQDLSKFGTYLIMALFGLIICIVINIFMKSAQLDWIISGAGVLIFIGLTAWDTQKIKQMAAYGMASDSRLATIGALSLYLDFVNLFLYLLRFFGGSRD